MLAVIEGVGGVVVFFEAKLMVAIGPLLENVLVLIIAILIEPGRDVLAANIAPDTSAP
jgi:hypothetical protein